MGRHPQGRAGLRGGPGRAAWALGLLLLAGGPGAAETHKDEQLGFSFSVPDGYRAIPIAGEEQYVVAKWQSEREYADPKEGWSHRPELKVVLFDPKGKKTAEVKEGADDVTRITVKNPYRTYKDWIKSDASGGRYVSKEEQLEVNGVPTTWYEVAYEKLTTPRHGLAFVYHASDVDYCITVEVLEAQWDKLSPALVRAFKSFKIFPRKGTIKREVTGEDDVIFTKDLSKLSPVDRLRRRTLTFEKNLRLATERLTEGWFVKRSKNYVALSHASPKFTDLILDQAEAVRAYADATFGWFGEGLPGPEMFRICKDYDEERSFTDLSSRSGGWTREITLSQKEGFWALGNLGGRIFDRWLEDKNPRLRFGMPPWLGNGIREWIGSAYVKGSRLEFRPDGDLIVSLKLAAKQKKLIGPREMMQMSSDELWKSLESTGGSGPLDDRAWRTSASQQAAGLVRYLLAGPGKSSARTKDLLRVYVTTLDQVLKEEDEKPPAGGESYKAPQTEEEEDTRFKNRETYWKDHEKDLLKSVFERVFKEWTDADWAAFEKSYRSYAS